MTTLTFTYDCTQFFITPQEHIKGESCMDITLSNGIACELMNGKRDKKIMQHIQQILKHSEALKGRTYIMGSIKDIRWE